MTLGNPHFTPAFPDFSAVTLPISFLFLVLSVLVPSICLKAAGDVHPYSFPFAWDTNSCSQTLASLCLFFFLNLTGLAHNYMFQGYIFLLINIFFPSFFRNFFIPHTAMKWFHFSFFHCGLDKGFDELSHLGLFVSLHCW